MEKKNQTKGHSMNDLLREQIKNHRKTDWKRFLREDLGTYHLKEIKPHLDIIKSFIDYLITNISSLSDGHQQILIDLLITFEDHKKKISNYDGTDQRDKIIRDIIDFKYGILDSFRSFALNLVIEDRLKSIDKEAKMNKDMIKVQQLQSQLKEKTAQMETARYGDFFKRSSKINKCLSLVFGYVFLLACVGSIFISYNFLKFDQNIEAKNLIELLIKGDVINKVFIFSVILIVISTIRREYLALRHQFTLNEHRSNAINSHKAILDAIQKTTTKSDKEISNAILLELTKAMFHSQETGFVKNQSSSSENKIVEISKSLFSDTKDS